MTTKRRNELFKLATSYAATILRKSLLNRNSDDLWHAMLSCLKTSRKIDQDSFLHGVAYLAAVQVLTVMSEKGLLGSDEQQDIMLTVAIAGLLVGVLRGPPAAGAQPR